MIKEEQEHVIKLKDQETILLEEKYEVWLKWASHEKQQNICQFQRDKINNDVPFLFQLEAANNRQPNIEIELDIVNEGRWDQIKKLIKVDPNFDQDKTIMQWQVLESYVDVFT